MSISDGAKDSKIKSKLVVLGPLIFKPEVLVSCSPSSGCSWMSRRHAISLFSICAARRRISCSRSGTIDCARADGTQAVTRSTSGNAKEQKKARHLLLPTCGDVAAASPECDSFEVCCHQCGLSEGCLAPIQCNVKDIVGWR